MKPRSPILGYNHNIRYAGRLYHVQTEDSGVGNPHIFTHLFHGGTILATKRIDYHAEDDVPAVQRVMQIQHKLMLKELRSGDFDKKIEGFFGEPVTRGALDTDPSIQRFEPASSQRKTDPNMRAMLLEAETAPAAPISAEGRPLRGYPTPPPGTGPIAVQEMQALQAMADADDAPPTPPTPPSVKRSKSSDMPAVRETDLPPAVVSELMAPGPLPPTRKTPPPMPGVSAPLAPPPPSEERPRSTTQPVNNSSLSRTLSRPPASRPVTTPNPMSGRNPGPRPPMSQPTAYSREPSAEGVVISRPAVIVTDLSPRPPVSTLTPPQRAQTGPLTPPAPRTQTPPPARSTTGPPAPRIRVDSPPPPVRSTTTPTPQARVTRPPQTTPSSQARVSAGVPRSPTPTPPPLAKPHRPVESDNIFGDDTVAEKSLDDVILAYLSEDLDK